MEDLMGKKERKKPEKNELAASEDSMNKLPILYGLMSEQISVALKPLEMVETGTIELFDESGKNKFKQTSKAIIELAFCFRKQALGWREEDSEPLNEKCLIAKDQELLDAINVFLLKLQEMSDSTVTIEDVRDMSDDTVLLEKISDALDTIFDSSL
jgi:hypothetical protein